MSIQIHMATINICNSRCHFCVYRKPENTRPRGTMSMDLYKKIIDEAATIPQIDSIAFSALGEPLLDKHIVERVAYAHKMRPDWTPFELYTNGVYLTPEKFDALRDAGVDSLTISLNAVNAKQHERIMGLVGKYETVVGHALYAKDNTRGKVDLLVKAVRDNKLFTESDQVEFYLRWGARLRPDLLPGVGQVVYMCNWAGEVKTLEDREITPDSCCARALCQFSILWDGIVSLCCYDPLAKYPFGDLKTQTIKEIYNSDSYLKFREMHAEDRAGEHPHCRVCTRV